MPRSRRVGRDADARKKQKVADAIDLTEVASPQEKSASMP